MAEPLEKVKRIWNENPKALAVVFGLLLLIFIWKFLIVVGLIWLAVLFFKKNFSRHQNEHEQWQN